MYQKPNRKIYHSNYTYTVDQPVKTRRFVGFKLLVAIVVVAGGFYMLFWNKKSDHAQQQSEVLAQSTAKKQLPMPDPIKIDQMSASINSIIANYPSMQVAVSVSTLNDEKSYNYGVQAGFLAASTGKLITACVYLSEVEQGKRSLDDVIAGKTARDQIKLMIQDSDNTAWKALNDELTHPVLDAWAKNIGLTSYDVENNIITASDISKLLTELYKGKILNDSHKDYLLGFMKNANETQYIVANVPSDVNVYHKAGWLDDRINDTAIIDNGKMPYVLVIYSKANSGNYDTQKGQKMYQEITQSSLALINL